MADYNFLYPDNAYGIPPSAINNYWKKMRQGGATTGAYIPNSMRRAEMEGMMDSLAKSASEAAKRRMEINRFNQEMSLKRDQFNAELDEKKKQRTTSAVAGLVTPLSNYFLMDKYYGSNRNLPKDENGMPLVTRDASGKAVWIGDKKKAPSPEQLSSFDEQPGWASKIGNFVSGESAPKTAIPSPSASNAESGIPSQVIGGQAPSYVQQARSGFGNAISTNPGNILTSGAVGSAIGNTEFGQKMGKGILFGRGGRNERGGAAGAVTAGLGSYLTSGDPYTAAIAALFGGFGGSRGFGLFG